MSFQDKVVDALSECLEAAVHTLLFERGVYPEAAFERGMLYGKALIHYCRHPEVREYVYGFLKRAIELLKQELLERIAVVLIAEDHSVLERFVFDIGFNPNDLWRFDRAQLEGSLCSIIQKVHLVESIVPRKRGVEVASFRLLAYVRKEIGNDAASQTIIQQLRSDWREDTSYEPHGSMTLTPLKSAQVADGLRVQLFVESVSR